MSNRGFTLIETIIYMAILTFLIGSGFTTAFYIIDSSQKNKSEVNIQAEGNFILRKIGWAITGASITSVTPTSLSLNSSSLIFSFDSSTNSLLLNGSRLNSGSATTSGSFTDIPASGGKPEGVTVNFTVNNKPFTLTKYLRK